MTNSILKKPSQMPFMSVKWTINFLKTKIAQLGKKQTTKGSVMTDYEQPINRDQILHQQVENVAYSDIEHQYETIDQHKGKNIANDVIYEEILQPDSLKEMSLTKMITEELEKTLKNDELYEFKNHLIEDLIKSSKNQRDDDENINVQSQIYETAATPAISANYQER